MSSLLAIHNTSGAPTPTPTPTPTPATTVAASPPYSRSSSPIPYDYADDDDDPHARLFAQLLHADAPVDLPKLRRAARTLLPAHARALVWRLLLNLPTPNHAHTPAPSNTPSDLSGLPRRVRRALQRLRSSARAFYFTAPPPPPTTSTSTSTSTSISTSTSNATTATATTTTPATSTNAAAVQMTAPTSPRKVPGRTRSRGGTDTSRYLHHFNHLRRLSSSSSSSSRSPSASHHHVNAHNRQYYQQQPQQQQGTNYTQYSNGTSSPSSVIMTNSASASVTGNNNNNPTITPIVTNAPVPAHIVELYTRIITTVIQESPVPIEYDDDLVYLLTPIIHVYNLNELDVLSFLSSFLFDTNVSTNNYFNQSDNIVNGSSKRTILDSINDMNLNDSNNHSNYNSNSSNGSSQSHSSNSSNSSNSSSHSNMNSNKKNDKKSSKNFHQHHQSFISYFNSNSENLHDNVSTFLSMFRSLHDDLYDLFINEDVDITKWARSWLRGLLIAQLPPQCLLRLWDVYFAGDLLYLHPFVCLVFVGIIKQKLLECDDAERIVEALSSLPNIDIDRVVAHAITARDEHLRDKQMV